MHCNSGFLWFFLLNALAQAQAFSAARNNIISDDDMRLIPAQMDRLKGNIRSRNIRLWSGYYWPNRTLVYSIGKGLNPSDILLIERAMRGISDQSCLRFRRTKNSKEPQIILQRIDSGCWSYIGYLGIQQPLNLGRGCMVQGIIQHELLHALAFLHMQSDPNRNNYVRILYENIIAGKENNFDIFNTKDASDFGLGYDYNSLMHYGEYAFSKNGKPTIIPLRKTAKIGQRYGLSHKDVLKLKRIYCL